MCCCDRCCIKATLVLISLFIKALKHHSSHVLEGPDASGGVCLPASPGGSMHASRALLQAARFMLLAFQSVF
jgi:hypothetical protein